MVSATISAQQITNQSNTGDQSYSIFQTNSPTNTYGNRWDIIWMNKNEMHIRNPKLFLDSTINKTLSLTNHPKIMWVDETTTQMKITTKDSITWPWNQITSKPYIFSGIDTISLSNRINLKFNSPTGTTSQYVRGDGSIASLPVYSAGTGLSLISGVFNNIMPDQTVTIDGTGSATVTNAYPNFTVNVPTNTLTAITASTGIGITSGSVITNTMPDQTVSITSANSDLSISSAYPSFTLTPYTKTTYTVTRSINSATFQPSATKVLDVNYCIAITCSASIASSANGKVILQYSTNNGSSWVDCPELENSNTISLAVALNSTTKQTASIIMSNIPAGAILRLVPTSTNSTITFVRGFETY